MKSKVKVERAERCDCLNPELIEQIAMGKYGKFTFCTKCNRERRLTQKELDNMIRKAK